MPPHVRHLTQADLSERFGGIPVETLRDWRREGKGPAYIRGDSKGDKATILYPLAAVEAWEKSHLVVPVST